MQKVQEAACAVSLPHKKQSGSIKKVGQLSPWTVKYLKAQGFLFIPREVWVQGLSKKTKARFFISSFSKALIVPAGYDYPHMTVSIADHLFGDPRYVGIRVGSMHYSQSATGPRIAFYPRKGDFFKTDTPLPHEDQLRANQWLEKAQIPFTLIAPSDVPSVVHEPPVDLDTNDAAGAVALSSATSEISPESAEENDFGSETEGGMDETVCHQHKGKPQKPSHRRKSKRGRSKKGAHKNRDKAPATPKKESAEKEAQKSESVERPVASPPVILFTQDFTPEWEKLLGVTDFGKSLEECDLGDATKYAGTGACSGFKKIVINYQQLVSKALQERSNSGYLINSTNTYERHFRKMYLGREQAASARASLKDTVRKMKESTSLFVEYGSYVTSRQQFSLPFIDPKDLPVLSDLLEGKHESADEIIKQAFADKLDVNLDSMSLKSPEGKHENKPEIEVAEVTTDIRRKTVLMNLRVIALLLKNLQTATYIQEMQAFGGCVAKAISIACPRSKTQVCALAAALLNMEQVVVDYVNTQEVLATQLTKDWYRLCHDPREIEEKLNWMNVLCIEYLSLCADMTELLTDADPSVAHAITGVFSKVPDELSHKLHSVGKQFLPRDKEYKVSSLHSHEELLAHDRKMQINYGGLTSQADAETLMDIMRQLHTAIHGAVCSTRAVQPADSRQKKRVCSDPQKLTHP